MHFTPGLWFLLAVIILVLVYLFYALLRPERF
ncbi:MAG: K(+)-transporting ATPase subunit F [Chloroflexota bacterium]